MLASLVVKYDTHGLIEKAISIEKSKATIANFGIGHIYSPIIPVTANIPANDKTFVIVERITQGQGKKGDIELLEEIGETIKQTAMCGLGQTAPNPILSTIRFFRDEYEEHINKKHCRAGVCSAMFTSPCENTCPANINISGYVSLIAAGRFQDDQ